MQPILEKLVGKTMEEALIEVLEEEEIAALKEQQRKFMELRAAERAEEKRLEEQERRIREEKVRPPDRGFDEVVFETIPTISVAGSETEAARGSDEVREGEGGAGGSGYASHRVHRGAAPGGPRRAEDVRIPAGRDQGRFVNSQEHTATFCALVNQKGLLIFLYLHPLTGSVPMHACLYRSSSSPASLASV